MLAKNETTSAAVLNREERDKLFDELHFFLDAG